MTGRSLEGPGQLRLPLRSLMGTGRHLHGKLRVSGHAAARRVPGGYRHAEVGHRACGWRAVLLGCHLAVSPASPSVVRLCVSLSSREFRRKPVTGPGSQNV